MLSDNLLGGESLLEAELILYGIGTKGDTTGFTFTSTRPWGLDPSSL